MTAARWHLAQLNVARAIEPLDSPRLAEFVAALEGVNALADAAPGFVWRLQGDDGDSTQIRVDPDPQLLVNMSVWTGPEALFEFVYRSGHTGIMVRRREWFERPAQAHQVLWWIPAGHVPTTAEGLERLERLRRDGPGPEAFTFKQRYPAPDQLGPPVDHRPDPYCVDPA